MKHSCCYIWLFHHMLSQFSSLFKVNFHSTISTMCNLKKVFEYKKTFLVNFFHFTRTETNLNWHIWANGTCAWENKTKQHKIKTQSNRKIIKVKWASTLLEPHGFIWQKISVLSDRLYDLSISLEAIKSEKNWVKLNESIR